MFGNATKVEAVKQSVAHWPLEEAYELATILDSVLDTAAALISCDAYAVWLLESSREEWSIAAGRGLSQTFTDQVRGGADIMPASPVCADDVESEDLLADRVLIYRREGIRSLMAVPVLVQHERRGTIVFTSATHIPSAREKFTSARGWPGLAVLPWRPQSCTVSRAWREPAPTFLPRQARCWRRHSTTSRRWPR